MIWVWGQVYFSFLDAKMNHGLGDLVHSALVRIGVTPSLVERWVGAPCGCDERIEKLNQLGYWARRVLTGRTAGARESLGIITGVASVTTETSKEGGDPVSRVG